MERIATRQLSVFVLDIQLLILMFVKDMEHVILNAVIASRDTLILIVDSRFALASLIELDQPHVQAMGNVSLQTIVLVTMDTLEKNVILVKRASHVLASQQTTNEYAILMAHVSQMTLVNVTMAGKEMLASIKTVLEQVTNWVIFPFALVTEGVQVGYAFVMIHSLEESVKLGHAMEQIKLNPLYALDMVIVYHQIRANVMIYGKAEIALFKHAQQRNVW